MKLKLKVNSTIGQTLLRSISRTVNVAPQSRLAFTVSQRALSHLRASDPQYWFFHPLKQPHEHKFCMRLLLAASALVRRHMMGAWMLRNNPGCSPKQAGPLFLKGMGGNAGGRGRGGGSGSLASLKGKTSKTSFGPLKVNPKIRKPLDVYEGGFVALFFRKINNWKLFLYCISGEIKLLKGQYKITEMAKVYNLIFVSLWDLTSIRNTTKKAALSNPQSLSCMGNISMQEGLTLWKASF